MFARRLHEYVLSVTLFVFAFFSNNELFFFLDNGQFLDNCKPCRGKQKKKKKYDENVAYE